MRTFRSQDMQRQASVLQEAAMTEPVVITYHDRPRLVLMSMQEYDRLRGRHGTPREAALPLWQEYQRLIAEQQPYTFVYFSERINGVHERLQNVNPDARGDWVGIDRWWIRPDQRVR